MLTKLIVRTAVMGVVSLVLWNSSFGQGIQDTVSNITATTSGVSSLGDTLSGLTDSLGLPTQVTTQAAAAPVSCSLTLVVPNDGPRDGLVSTLRSAAQDMNSITGMRISVVREGEKAASPKVPVVLLDDTSMTQVNRGTPAYAAVQTEMTTDGVVTSRTYYINNDMIYDLAKGTGAGSRYNVLLHELGHLAGVGHTEGDADLMSQYPSQVAGVTQADRDVLSAATASCRS